MRIDLHAVANSGTPERKSSTDIPLDAGLPERPSSGASAEAGSRFPASDAPLANDLVGSAPSLPEGRRGAVISLLTGLMADGERMDRYVASLKTAIDDRGTEWAAIDRFHRLNEAQTTISLITAEGFSRLGDEHLAALAVSPRALKALYEHLEAPETLSGDWLMDAMMAAHGDRPELRELDEHAKAMIARLIQEGASGDY
jgi:hypothetical protein